MKPVEKIATREYIESLAVGSQAPNCFGEFAEISSIFAFGDNIHEKKYICYYTKFGENGWISHSLSEGEPLFYL